jgi:hypothetical protein
MNADQVSALGGLCELVGVGFVARDLMALARYRGKLAELAARLQAWRLSVVATVRRLLRRPRRQVRHVGLAGEISVASRVSASATGMRGPFTPRPGESLEDQIAELGLLVNRLREEIVREPRERERAIAAEREARREELRAEAERLELLITMVQQDVEKLRDATTGDLGLRVESVVFLVTGIFLATWPEQFARWFPTWPPFRVAAFIVCAYPLGRYSWVKWLRPREDLAEFRSTRVGCAVLWHGPSR